MDSETVESCPTDVAFAPAERVWDLVTNPSHYQWVDAKLIEAPTRSLQVGDRLVFAASLGLRLSWTVLALDPPRELALDIRLPFGLANRETIMISPLDDDRCRVTFG